MKKLNYKIYFENINVFGDKNFYEECYHKVSDGRRKKIDGYRFENDKKLSLLSEILLKKILLDYEIKEELCKININYNAYGKPYLKDYKNIYFNISHSGEYVMCVASDKEIGCDIQETKKEIDIDIAKRFFEKEEYENILLQDTDYKKKELFYRYWVLKESYIKAVGCGLSMPLDSFKIVIKDNDIKVENKNELYKNKKYYLKELDDITGYKMALCIEIV